MIINMVPNVPNVYNLYAKNTKHNMCMYTVHINKKYVYKILHFLNKLLCCPYHEHY